MLLITNRATATAITTVTTTTMSATTTITRTTAKRNEQPTMWKTNKTNPKGCCFFCCCCWHLLLSLSRVATPCCSYNLPHLLLDLACDTTTPPTQISRGDLRDLSDVLCIFYDKQAITTATKPAAAVVVIVAAGGQPGPETCETGTEDCGLRTEGET